LTIVEKLPSGRDRDGQELALRSSLSVSLNSKYGYAANEVEQNLERVFALSASMGRGELPVRWLWVAFTLRFMRGDLRGTREAAEQALARSRVDPASRCEAHHAMGGTLSSLGEHEAAREHFEAALHAYDEQHPQRSALGSDLGVFAHAWYSHSLWLLGDETAALRHAAEAIALSQRLDHKYSQTLALAYAAMLHQMRGDAGQVRTLAEAAVGLCDRYEFGYYGDWARVLLGWVCGHEQPDKGAAVMESALAGFDESRAQARRPYYLSLLAETYARQGQRDRVVSILDQAIILAEQRGDGWWLPALYLQRGELHSGLAREEMLQRALALAHSQHARGLERRIAATHD
jgi:tetratricopeptide (TPR) repeat protein